MVTRLEARTQPLVIVSAGGAELFVTYTCPLGHAAIIAAANASHNDTVARNPWWELDTGAGFGITGSDLGQIEFGVLPNALHHLYNVMIQPWGALGLMLRAGQALRWNVDVKTNGKVLTMRLMVDEYLGETPYGS